MYILHVGGEFWQTDTQIKLENKSKKYSEINLEEQA